MKAIKIKTPYMRIEDAVTYIRTVNVELANEMRRGTNGRRWTIGRGHIA